MEFKEKVVVITGGSSGLGKSLAAQLRKRGATVIISARASDELTKTAQELGVAAVSCDVTNEEDVNNLVAQVVSQYGRLDVFINNAGVWTPRASVLDIAISEIRRLMEVNFYGLVYGSRAALSYMAKLHQGTIVNIISTSALQGRPKSSGYSATKFAAAGFTKALILEAKEMGVTVYAMYPGGIKTNLFNAGKPDDYQDYMEADHVANRIVVHVESDNPNAELELRRPGQT